MDLPTCVSRFHQVWFNDWRHVRVIWFSVLVIIRFCAKVCPCINARIILPIPRVLNVPGYDYIEVQALATILIGWQIVFDCALCTIDCIKWIRKLVPHGESLCRLGARFRLVAVATLVSIAIAVPKGFFARMLWTSHHCLLIQMLHLLPYFAVRMQTVFTGMLVAALKDHQPRRAHEGPTLEHGISSHTLSNCVLILYSFGLCISTYVSLYECVWCILAVIVCVGVETVARFFLVHCLNSFARHDGEAEGRVEVYHETAVEETRENQPTPNLVNNAVEQTGLFERRKHIILCTRLDNGGDNMHPIPFIAQYGENAPPLGIIEMETELWSVA